MKKKLIAVLTALLCISLLCVSSYAVLNQYETVDLWGYRELGTGYVNVPSTSAATAWTRVSDNFPEDQRFYEDYIYAGFVAYTPSEDVWYADEANDEIEFDGMRIPVVQNNGANYIEVSGSVRNVSGIIYVNSYHGISFEGGYCEDFSYIYEVYPGVPN